DEAGYLAADLDDVAAQLGAEPAVVEACLCKIQTLDPPGIAARSLKECLSIQLEARGDLTLEMEALVDNLPLIARRDYASLKKICEVDTDDLRAMIAKIRQLNPKPATTFGSVAVQTVIPD